MEDYNKLNGMFIIGRYQLLLSYKFERRKAITEFLIIALLIMPSTFLQYYILLPNH
jgi:hypothetical protein